MYELRTSEVFFLFPVPITNDFFPDEARKFQITDFESGREELNIDRLDLSKRECAFYPEKKVSFNRLLLHREMERKVAVFFPVFLISE